MEESGELLEHIFKDANMGTKSITTLLKSINNKNNKIKKTCEEVLKGYEKFVKISENLINKYNLEPKKATIIAEIGSSMGIKMELIKDNSDSRIADMLIKGLNMGVIRMTKKIDDYKNCVDKDIIKVAKEFCKFQENTIELLKEYL